MELLKDQRAIALGGGTLALAAGLIAAWVLIGHKPAAPPPAAQGGLVVVSGRDDDAKLDPKRPLRCFVGGQFVGELPLAVCAQRNGVATGALDVGLDQAGALAATNGVNSTLTPLPAPEAQATDAAQAPPQSDTGPPPAAASGAAQACWRFGGAGWRQLPAPIPLPACISALFAGRCPIRDDAFYGRWGEQTLRLVQGRVEISSNNRDFSPIVDPWPPCRLDPG